MNSLFPFPGITGQEHAKKALLCSLVNEEIRTVLITGERGTAKSTLVRSVETISGEKKMFTVPQNITYDRLLGAIDLENAVSTGSIHYTPGLLEQGKGQILYADDVNLLDEDLVQNILNASETGHFTLEREGLSHMVTTRFTFLATMDAAQGELSPGQMDRFDLCVRLDPVEDRKMRAEIVRKNLKFEHDAGKFSDDHERETTSLKESIEAARERLPYVSIPEGHADLISSLCLELGIAGQRGDIALARTAKALAALDGRDGVVFDDIKLAALLAIEHRRCDVPSSPPPVPQRGGRESSEREGQNKSERPQAGSPTDRERHRQEERDGEIDTDRTDLSPPPPADRVFDIGSTFEVIRYLDEMSRKVTGKQRSGRRTRVTSTDSSGRYHSSRLLGKNRNDIAVDATLRAAAPHQISRERQGLAISVKTTDLREKVREKKVAHTVLFLVDASGSMGVHRRMVAVKGAILSLLADAYQKRDRVGLMTFRGTDARLLLPPTGSPDLAIKLLRKIPTGGTTPLARGIADAYRLLTRGKFAAAGGNRSIVLLTDGRGNVPMENKPPSEELIDLAKHLAGRDVRFVVVDTELGFPRLGRARALAGDLEASYIRLDDLDSRRLAGAVTELVHTGR
ncbi:MAG: VWA domain-containing protein [Methanoregulaceae archaeon]|jgi:magnesium chelatase subunit D